MLNLIRRIVVAAGVGVVAAVGVAAVAAAGPSSTITVQDQGGPDGARVAAGPQGRTDVDGTQGAFKQATDGTTSGPLMDAVPQFKAIPN